MPKPARANADVSTELREKIAHVLREALERAESDFAAETIGNYILSDRLRGALEKISELSPKATTGLTNIITCLAIKAAKPDVDIRYHQVQIQDQTPRGAGFNFRGVSENTVYPWLAEHSLGGAKSGWQTRTFERPKPYILTYDENIGDIKQPFLNVFDEVEEYNQSGKDALDYLIYLQVRQRESSKVVLSIPKTDDIRLILNIFQKHFFHKYKNSKGASRLPVLALYAIYSVLVDQLERYKGMALKPLQEHSAADAQTGSVGDIEVTKLDSGEVFEALEIKHDIQLSETIIQDVARKIMDKTVDRYYVLTTHKTCEPDTELAQKINQISSLYKCQIIANGVIPSIKYYLRLLSRPSLVFPKYVELLKIDKTIKHEHKEIWNDISTMP